MLILTMIHQRTGVSALPGLRAFPRLSTGAERALLIVGSVLCGADSSEMELNVMAISLQRPPHRSVSIADDYASAVLAVEMLSVRLSVRLLVRLSVRKVI